MKKFIICFVLIASVLALTACLTNGGPSVDQCWAAKETLVYSVYDASKGGAKVGDATFDLITKENFTEEDKAAQKDADTKVVSTFNIGDKVTTTTYYAKNYRPLSLKRVYTDASEPKNDYTLTAHHDGKNYVYDLSYPNAAEKSKNGKINVGSTGYSDNEFMYYYMRCYDLASTAPAAFTVADPFTDSAVKLACSIGAKNVTINAETTKLNAVSCIEVNVRRSETPVGGGLSVYYLPKTKEYTYGQGSMIKSSGFPVKIVENNLSFILRDFTPTV